jgi:hypothetical protein
VEERGPSAAPGPRGVDASRPWYLVFTMVLMWLFGMTSSATGCSNVSYLRGSHELPDALGRMMEALREAESIGPRAAPHGSATAAAPVAAATSSADPTTNGPVMTSAPPDRVESASPPVDRATLTHPLVRASLVREQARLEALASVQRRAFPFALAQTMLGMLLVVAATSVLSKRPGSRGLALQAIGAHALLAVVSFSALASVRYAMVDAVAADLVRHPPSEGSAVSADSAFDARRAELLATDRQLLSLQLGMFALATVALTRPRTKALFDAVDASAPHDDEP